MKISDETLELIEFAKKKSKESNDAFDISIYPIVELWDFRHRISCAIGQRNSETSEKRNSQKIKINK